MSYEERRADARKSDDELDVALTELGVDLHPSPEWRVVMALLRGAFPGDLTKGDELAYLTVLSDLPERDIARAVREIARSGQRFRPTPGEIREQLDLNDAESAPPLFDEAWALIEQAGKSSAYNAISALALLEQAHHAVATWARLRTLATLWREPIHCPDYGRIALRELRRSYEQHADAWSNPKRRALMMQRGSGKLSRLSSSSLIGDLSEQQELAAKSVESS
jgi:hypothetical protein